jgi:enamine deaminase RidA (YjgF/YER057c/UK114 family)
MRTANQQWRDRGMYAVVLTSLIALSGGSAVAQHSPLVVQGPTSEAVYLDERHKAGNDGFGYAAAHRAGDTLYVSGVVAGSWDDVVLDNKGLEDSIRRAFTFIGRMLEAGGGDFSNVVDLLTFHVWDSVHFDGDKRAQMDAIVKVKDEFMGEPDPAWTAIGTTGLIPDTGIIEIRVTAYIPGSGDETD